MKIILREDIPKIGKIGDVVNVRPGFARNFLLPQGKAERASRDAIERFAEQRAEWEARQQKRREFVDGLAGRIDGYMLQISAKAGADGKLYGSVTAATVCHALNAEQTIRDLDFSLSARANPPARRRNQRNRRARSRGAARKPRGGEIKSERAGRNRERAQRIRAAPRRARRAIPANPATRKGRKMTQHPEKERAQWT